MLSVVIPNYNHSRYLRGALEAILSQSRVPDEIVVVDDGSTDESTDLVRQFSCRDARIQLIENGCNRGVVFSMNRGLKSALGDWIYFASADDQVLPGFFEKSMALLEQHPYAGLCCSDPASFVDGTDVLSPNPKFWSDTPVYWEPEQLVNVLWSDYIAGHTSIVNRAVLKSLGGFCGDLQWHCDWFVMLAIAFCHGMCYIPEPLAAIRVRSDSLSASGRRNWKDQSAVLSTLFHMLKSEPFRDLLPAFARANTMSHFGREVVQMMAEREEHWDATSFALTYQITYGH